MKKIIDGKSNKFDNIQKINNPTKVVMARFEEFASLRCVNNSIFI